MVLSVLGGCKSISVKVRCEKATECMLFAERFHAWTQIAPGIGMAAIEAERKLREPDCRDKAPNDK